MVERSIRTEDGRFDRYGDRYFAPPPFFLRGACALQARGDLRRLERFWSAIHDSEIEITFEKKCASQRPKTAFFLL